MAAEFYAALFPRSHVGPALVAPGDYPAGHEGDELAVEFTVLGAPFLGLNGRPAFTPNEAASFIVETQDQADLIREIGFETGQGYLFSRPLKGADLVGWMAQQPPGKE